MHKPNHGLLVVFQIAFVAFAVTAMVATSQAADTVIVVRPAGWSDALEPWRGYRQRQGYKIVEIDSVASGAEVQKSIRKMARDNPGEIKAILIACDVGRLPESKLGTPMFYHASKALVKFGGDEQIASDSTYADLDGDDLPDVSIGRIPADTPQQLADVLARTIACEQNLDSQLWRRDIHVIAGVGGFGAIADSAIEMTTRQFLSQRIPGWANVSMTQASPQSPFCPDPWKFSETTVQRLNQGGMFWIYIGHGHVKTLDYLRCNEEWLPIFTEEHVAKVDTVDKPPIAIFLACYTGAMDAVEDSLAEKLVMHSGGPVASLAASRVSGPYGLAMLSNGLLSQCFENQTSTLGEIVLNAKRAMMQPADDMTTEKKRSEEMLNAVAKALSPEGYDLQAEKQEHIWMMNLIGDPLLKLHYPAQLALDEIANAKAGDKITLRGKSPLDGQLHLELAYRRDQNNPSLIRMDAFSPDDKNRRLTQQRYKVANDRIITPATVPVSKGEFECQLQIPNDLARGKYCVRCFVNGNGKWAAGYQIVNVRVP
jgi:Peptidase family C25